MMLALLPLLLPAPAAVVPAQAMCTMEYRPVCAVVEGRRRTFPNSCAARRAGASRMARGACSRRR